MKRQINFTKKASIVVLSNLAINDTLRKEKATDSRMKILIVSPRFPYKQGKADSMTVFHLIEYLTNKNHEVILATFHNNERFPQAERDLMEQMCKEVKVVKLNQFKKGVRLSLNMLGRKPFQVAYYQKKEMQTSIAELITKHQPDVLYAHLIRSAEYFKDYQSIPKILAMQIAQTLNYKRLIQHEQDLLRKIFYQREYQRVKRYEPQIIKNYERVLLISPHDKKAINSDLLQGKTFFSPHGIDVDYFSEDLRFKRETNTIVMNGDFGVPTNIDGALHFYHKIYPLVKKEIPNVKLWLVGRNPHSSIKKLAQDQSVLVTGRVSDIRPYLQRATVGIAPMRVAAGLQNKILVSLASELPVVASKISNEGIGAPENEVLLVGKDENDFANKIIALLKDENQRKTLGKNARKFMQACWTWDFHFEKLEEMMLDLAKDREAVVENYYPLS